MANVMSMLEKLKLIEKMEKSGEVQAASSNENVEGTEEFVDSNITEDYVSEDEEVDFGEYKPPTKKSEEIVEQKPKMDKKLTVNEIYDLNNIEDGSLTTVFLLENFINALPQNLPYDVKKASVINIVKASNANLDNLLAEGENRVKVLNEFMDEFQQTLDGSISEYKLEILKLTKQIDQYKAFIREKEEMLDEQKNVIKFESQKINNIIDFFNNQNKY